MPKALPRIEAANALDLPTFTEKYFTSPELPTILRTNKTTYGYSISLESSSTISTADFNACFDLIASTSSRDYANSSIKWSPAKKRKEMRLPNMRYILLKLNSVSPFVGFLSFMLTYEDGLEVIYCYELHIAEDFRRCSLGARLVQATEEIGRRVGVGKLMLTVFRANETALAFYQRLGFGVDKFSPEPRMLRNGVLKESDYLILSKELLSDPTQQDLGST